MSGYKTSSPYGISLGVMVHLAHMWTFRDDAPNKGGKGDMNMTMNGICEICLFIKQIC